MCDSRKCKFNECPNPIPSDSPIIFQGTSLGENILTSNALVTRQLSLVYFGAPNSFITDPVAIQDLGNGAVRLNKQGLWALSLVLPFTLGGFGTSIPTLAGETFTITARIYLNYNQVNAVILADTTLTFHPYATQTGFSFENISSQIVLRLIARIADINQVSVVVSVVGSSLNIIQTRISSTGTIFYGNFQGVF